MNNDYEFWQSALNGKVGPIHDGDPQCGYYRKRNKDRPDTPVAIWKADGEFVALEGERVVDPEKIWMWVADKPIPYDVYKEALKNGWADEPPAPKTHNLPDDPREAIEIELASEKEQAEEFLANPIESQEQADMAAAWAKRLTDISKKVDNHRKMEKQPHLDAGKAVDEAWNPIRDNAKDLATRLKKHLNPWLQKQAEIEAEKQRRAREEVEHLEREVREAEAKEQGQPYIEELQARMEAAQRAKEDVEQAAKRNTTAGSTGRKVSLRTFVSAEITDFDALLAALKDRREVVELVQSLANRAAKSGVELPGMKRVEEKRAA